MIYNYIVVGAGISGIYFSHLIKSMNPSVKLIILESSNDYGGRILKDHRSGAQMGAKFVHDYFNRFDININKNKFYKLGNLSNQSNTVKQSMYLEEMGSIDKCVHSSYLEYEDEKNYPYDYTKYLEKLIDDLQIKYKTPFTSYTKQENYYLVNTKYKTERIVFATSPNVLKQIPNPYQNYFKHYLQANIITLAFCLGGQSKVSSDLVPGFSFYEEFLRTSFYFDSKAKILYVNLFDRHKNFSTKNIETKIVDKFSLKNYKLNKKEWSKGDHLLGAWTLPKSTLSPKIVETLETGYDNSIFYVGDYLGDIDVMGRATGCMRSAESLVDRLS
jgi:hypothetical protein